MRLLALGIGLLVTSLGAASGQGAPQSNFEVASVKIAGPPRPGFAANTGGPGTADPGRISYPRIGLKELVMNAYGVKADQVMCPDWADRYSIEATLPPKTTLEEFHAMLQNLLAERFELKFHHETRDFPVYELVVAEGGAKMQKSAEDAGVSTSPDPTHAATGAPLDQDGFPVLPPGARQQGRWGNGVMRSTYRAWSMEEFAGSLGALINLSDGAGTRASPPRVVNHTGLSGEFDFKLEFAGSPFPVTASMPGPQETPVATDPGGGGPSLSTALEKQLGLKLVKGKKTNLDVLVIDHADKVPLEN